MLSFEDERSESLLDRTLALACIALTVIAFVLAFWTAFAGR
jgi:hypothetical protein